MGKTNKLTSVITGDIINSRKVQNSRLWLSPLKKTLSSEGNSPKTWEIYRGDSFQLEIKDPSKALLIALKIKVTIKCTKGLDVRMAIGIGQKDFIGSKVTESNGEAFVNSGEKLETIKKAKQNLAIKTSWPEFDKEINLCIRLGLIAMDNWTTGAAQLIKILINNQDITQIKLAKKLKISQSSVSEKKKRAFYSEIMELESFYQEKIRNLIKT
jgi:hypothetical protein